MKITDTIKFRLTLTFICLAVCPLILVGSLLAWQVFVSQRSQAVEYEREVAQRVSIDTAAYFDEIISQLNIAAVLSNIMELGYQQQNDYLSILMAKVKSCQELILVDKTGEEKIHIYDKLISSSHKFHDMSNTLEFREPFRTGKNWFSSVKVKEATGEPTMTIALPLKNLQLGSNDGVLIAVVHLKNIWQMIENMDLRSGENVYIVDKENRVVAHPNPSVVLRDTRFETPEKDGFCSGLNHTKVVMAFSKVYLGNQELTVIAERNVKQALTLAIRTIWTVVLVLTAVFVIAAMVGIAAVRKTILPIHDLAQVARSIQAGDLEREAVISTKDEIADLAKAFNDMTGKLKQLLQDRIKAEMAIKESEEKYRGLYDKSRDAIMILDPNVGFISGNPSTIELFGCKDEAEFISKTPVTLSPKHQSDGKLSSEKAKEMINIALEKGSNFFEWKHCRVDKQEFYASVLLTRMHMDNKEMLQATVRDITSQKLAEQELAKHRDQLEDLVKHRTKELQKTHEDLVEASRHAGMAEVATNILHNVGNVLNSINISAGMIRKTLFDSKIEDLQKIADLMEENNQNIEQFFLEDQKGKHLSSYLIKLSKILTNENSEIAKEVNTLSENIDHIKEVVRMQQSYSKVLGLKVPADLKEIVENAIHIDITGLEKHRINIERDFVNLPEINIDKQRVLQILVNLIRNAKDAVSCNQDGDRIITVRFYKHGQDFIRIEVADNGVGISEENLTKVFSHGFTTKENGHGFGLHSGALAAKEMGGSMKVHSEGPGKGATFILELPYEPVILSR